MQVKQISNEPMNTVNYQLLHKLQSLVSFLKQVTKGFDAIAEEIDNTNLRTALIALSVESKQYAKEICNHLHKFNITLSEDCTDETWKQIETCNDKQCSSSQGGEIATICENCEMYFSTLYRDALKEYFPYKSLKDIILYQLYAAQCSFMKIKLLNKLRFSL